MTQEKSIYGLLTFEYQPSGEYEISGIMKHRVDMIINGKKERWIVELKVFGREILKKGDTSLCEVSPLTQTTILELRPDDSLQIYKGEALLGDIIVKYVGPTSK